MPGHKYNHMGDNKKNEDLKTGEPQLNGGDAAADQVTENESLKATIATQAQIIEDQQKKMTDLENTIDEKTAEIIDLSAEIKKLQSGNQEISVKEKKPEPRKKVELPKEPVEYDGKKYRFRFAAFHYKAIRYEAQDVALDEKLIAEILSDKNQTLLKEIF